MTPEQVLEKMQSLIGEENFANPEHYPKVFEHQVKMAKWILELEEKAKQSQVMEQKP